MESTQFWTLLESARSAAAQAEFVRETFLQLLEDALLALPPEEVASFHTQFMQQYNRTFHWDVVAAAVIIFGDRCDDLDIEGFRAWLVSRGEEFLNKSLQNVDWLAELDLTSDEVYYYSLLSVAGDVYQQLTGDELPAASTPAEPKVPAGVEFQVKDLPKRLPLLADNFAYFVEDPNAPATEAPVAEADDDFSAIFADVPDEQNPYAE